MYHEMKQKLRYGSISLFESKCYYRYTILIKTMAAPTKKEQTKPTAKKSMSVEDYIKTQFPKYDEAMKKLADA